MDEQKTTYEFGPFRLDPAKHLLLRDGQAIPLTPKAFETLRMLVENSQQVVGKDELMQAIWPDTFVEEGSLTRNIYLLRKTLGENPNDHRYIVTVPGRGYRFVANVREVQVDGAELVAQESYSSSATVEREAGAGDQRGGEIASSEAKRKISKTLGLRVLAAWGVLFGLVIAAVYLWTWNKSKHSEANDAIRIIAVLPFKPLSADGSDEYLGLGMADDLITRLSNIREIVVRPTSTVRKYSSQDIDPIAAGLELKVQAVLEGNIQRVDDRIRVTVRLMRVSDGKPLWAERFDEKFTDMLAVQDAISEKVAGALTLRLTGEERTLVTKDYTQKPEAYQAYLKGRYYLNNNPDIGSKKAIEYFNQAIEMDPNYALAYAGLADACVSAIGWYLSPTEAWARGSAAAAKALEIDETLAEAHVSAAQIRFLRDWNWPEAEREYKRASELNPNYADAHHYYAFYLGAIGRFDEAIAEIKRAQELNPFSPAINNDFGWILAFARRYDQAITQFRMTLDMDRNTVQAHWGLAMIYGQRGMHEEAVAEDLIATELTGIPSDKTEALKLREAYAKSGWRGYKRELLELIQEEEEESKRTYISPYSMAIEYTVAGETDQAFKWLERAYDERYQAMVQLKVDPRFDSLRSDPRFIDLIRRIGLPP
jgi:DNA-binding winged helix-turn-helix (wHTH) protein/TolB-like protein/Tfp pilus assembly protein PilF